MEAARRLTFRSSETVTSTTSARSISTKAPRPAMRSKVVETNRSPSPTWPKGSSTKFSRRDSHQARQQRRNWPGREARCTRSLTKLLRASRQRVRQARRPRAIRGAAPAPVTDLRPPSDSRTMTRSGASSWRSTTTIRSFATIRPSSRSTPRTASKMPAQNLPLRPRTKPRTSSDCSRSQSRKQASRPPVSLPRGLWAYCRSRCCSPRSGPSDLFASKLGKVWPQATNCFVHCRRQSPGNGETARGRRIGIGRVDGFRTARACLGVRSKGGLVPGHGCHGREAQEGSRWVHRRSLCPWIGRKRGHDCGEDLGPRRKAQWGYVRRRSTF